MSDIPSKTSTNKINNISESERNEIYSISGVVKGFSMDNIQVRLIYDISVMKKVFNQMASQETSKHQLNINGEELGKHLNNIILSHCTPIFSTNSIIFLPNALKLDKNNLLENIKINLLNQGVSVEKFGFDVLTTPELKPKKRSTKFISWILNLIYILGSISVIYIVYFFK